MLLVFYGHLSGSGNNPWFPDLMVSRTIIYYFHMPLFFVLSGLTLRFNDNFIDFVSKRVRRLIVPYFFFSLYAIMKILLKAISPSAFASFHSQSMQDSSKELLNILIGNTEGLWFFWALFWGNLLLWGVHHFLGDKGTIAIVPICLIAWYLLSSFPVTLPFQLSQTAEAAAFTGIGFLLFKSLVKIDRNKLIVPTVLSLALFSASAGLLLTIDSSNTWGRALPVICAALTGSFLIIGISQWILPAKWLTFIGKNTIIFYGLNGLSLAIAKFGYFHIFDTAFIASNAVLQLLSGIVVIGIACFICFFACLIINKWFWWAVGKPHPQISQAPSHAVNAQL